MGYTVDKNVAITNSFVLPKVKLIVGLGNFGEQYAKTRHNVGFMAVDEFRVKPQLAEFKEKKRLKAFVSENPTDNGKVILIKPTTYMNLSGQAVEAAMKFYRVEVEDILVIYDDVDIEFGTLQSKVGGGSAGHNGIKSVIALIGEDFARLRVGVKNNTLGKQDTADFVLNNFSKAENEALPKLLKGAGKKVKEFLA